MEHPPRTQQPARTCRQSHTPEPADAAETATWHLTAARAHEAAAVAPGLMGIPKAARSAHKRRHEQAAAAHRLAAEQQVAQARTG